MHKHSLFCRAAALVLTLALTAALALPGFAALRHAHPDSL